MKEAKIIVFAAVVIAVFGVVLPYLFSAASTELVGAGILIVAVIAGVALSRAMSVDWRDLAKRAGLVALLLTVGVGCSKVPAGHVGVKVYLLGGAKGVDSEELPVGRYWIGINEELYLFPTFQQNYVWTQDADEEAFILDQPVAETWAEVAALIAEAESKERRARALPVMAAIAEAVHDHSYMDAAGCAAKILDAIERLEATDV